MITFPWVPTPDGKANDGLLRLLLSLEVIKRDLYLDVVKVKCTHLDVVKIPGIY